MSQPLRLTYQNSDIMFYILNEKPSETHQKIDVSVKGETYQLHKSAGKWELNGDINNPEYNLINAIGNVIALRYRI
ncbi:hypothetical protein [Mucilaginibacter paludis]|uniref:Uncharacterized protein n=1 Tax=Mucilaginibacter paludis DSM 18603 TaxID=714943 RepID=H1Y6Y6_9SPHI|nr:hypothetical protein [Mucilaginibacter paludis]EHQ28393.1 hypothetical protein Mucpa_4303 [Mucilaginibacter paludis DSM 18603]